MKALTRMISAAVLALIVPTVQSSESGRLAASPFGLLAGSSPSGSSNVQAALITGVDMRNMDMDIALSTAQLNYTCFLETYEAGGLPALLTTSRSESCAAGCPLPHYQMFYDYYG